MKLKRIILILVLVALAGGIYYRATRQPHAIVLTGIVTTDEVIVSPEIQGQIERLCVDQGDTVTKGQLLAVIQPQEQLADVSYYGSTEQQFAMQIDSARADLQMAQLTYDRDVPLFKQHGVSAQDMDKARTNLESAKAHYAAASRQAAAAAAQQQKAEVILGYTRLYSPIDGIVDTRVALQGEVVNIAQPIVTLINPDDLWVRADVPETYIDQIHLGEKLSVTLPSGSQRQGTVFYRGIDADYATQRDVSRTKRDIRTFEIRVRCDNADRSLAVGMTAYVTLPLE
ncbi:MAG TPA: efflux RND transporter periplasmic adaptor subunit [Tepidisphaeraceae bacterium]|nr:efflux RND transporter periplasmic adaptor subunit [Tepidisphaeraceae bacterium]